jgi:signal transduction histidine kinase
VLTPRLRTVEVTPSAESAAADTDAASRAVAAFSAGLAYAIALLDADLRIIWKSPSLDTMLRWSDSELRRISAVELVHPEDLGDVARLLGDAVSSPTPFGADSAQRATNVVRLRTGDGSYVAVEFAANNLLDDPAVRGMLIVLRDVTERRLLDDVYELLATGSVDDVSARIVDLLSWQLGTEVRLVAADVAVEPSSGVWRHVVPDTGLAIDVESGSGAARNEWWRILVDRAAGFVRLVAARELGNSELRRALGDRTALMSAVSHDLASPIAAIRMLSTLLDQQGDHLRPAQRIEMIKRIERDAHHTAQVLGDLRAVDRMLRDPESVPFTALRVADLVAEVVTAETRDHGADRVIVEPIGDDVETFGDPALISRSLANLVANSLAHATHGCTTVVGASTDGTTVRIWVADDGPGVHPSMRESLFDAGVGTVRADGARSGLGLFLVRSFVNHLGGTVRLDPTWQPGARFVIELPAGPGHGA